MSNLTTVPVVELLPQQTFVAFSVFALSCLVFVCLAFRRYAAPTSYYVIVATIAGWWFASLIVFVIPMDVASSIFLQCEQQLPVKSAACAAILSNPPILSFLDPRKVGVF
jgi:hypothetical protein